MTSFKHWRLNNDEQGITWLAIDKADTATNVLAHEVMAELGQVLEQLEKHTPKALIIYSGKTSGFIAGADIKEFTALKTEEEAHRLIRNGQMIFDRLANLPCPTVAMIHGFALGGGMELALACRYRVASDDDSTRLGLPEVQLGIHPGFGGTVRTIQRMNPLAALNLMLTGTPLRASAALKVDLVDAAVPERHLKRVATDFALNIPYTRQRFIGRMLNTYLPRNMLALFVARKVAERAPKDHYPAPYAMIHLWRKYAGDPATMMLKEAESIARLMMTPTSRQLVRLFLLQSRLKSMGYRDFNPQHVHVIGAGVMGGDIAAWCASRGMRVTLQDREAKYIAPALKRAHEFFAKKLRGAAVTAAKDRLQADVSGDGVVQADVVIEAIYENVEAKQALFSKLESRLKPEAVLATNTSSLKLEILRATLQQPTRLIGLHFFNPVAKMPLVEVISAPDTDNDALERGLSFVRSLDRLPLPCRSAPGFVVNRVLMPYVLEAMRMLEDGVSMTVIDRAARAFGMPMGPIELADTIGLDVALHVGKVFAMAFDLEVPTVLTKKVEAGELGRKTSVGFYRYRKGKVCAPTHVPPEMLAAEAAPSMKRDELIDRMMLPMVNECIKVLHERVVTDADLLDAAVIFGTGFAPFRGGPMQYARDRGVADITSKLKEFSEKYGERFQPASGWDHVNDTLPQK